MSTHPGNPTRFLWWSAFWSLVFGGVFAYLVYQQNGTDPSRWVTVRQIIMASVLIAGICVIGAMSRLWIRR